MKNCCAVATAALVCAVAGSAVSAQVTLDGKVGPGETGLYGAPKWVQTIPTSFGDNFDGAGAGGASVGNPGSVTTGIELAIPFSALGTALNPYTGGQLRIVAMVNGADRGFLSNQVLGGITLNLGNLGEPRAVNFNGILGDQFVQTTPFSNTGTTAVVNGTLDTGLYGPIRSTQTNYTGFGDPNHGQIVRRLTPAENDGSELDNIRVAQKDGVLYVFIGGNLEANFNKLELFFDTIPGGQNRLGPTNVGDVTRLSDDGSGNGLTFDAAFAADFYVTLNGGNTAASGDPENNQIFVNYATLPTDGGGASFFCGSGSYASTGALSGGDTEAPAILATVNNSNIAGVIGTEVGGANAAPNVDRAYGSELDALYAYVDEANMKMYLLVAGNLQINYNKVDLFIDAAPGGQNRLRGASQQITTPSGNVFYSGNVTVDFNGLNNMGADTLALSDPMNELSERVPVNGLKFDAGFEPDYWISYTNGLNNGQPAQFMNAGTLRTGGIARLFTGAPLDFGCFDGGDKAANNPVNYDGPTYAAPTGFEPFTGDLSANYAPRHISELLAGIPQPTALLLRGTMDNSNVAGVTGISGDGAASVTTGMEFEIDLRELGWDGTSPIRVAGFVNGTGHDFISNQVLGGLPAGDAPTGFSFTSLGNPRTVDFGTIPGDQFVTVFTPGGTGPTCTQDYNGVDGINGDDLADYIADFFDSTGIQPGFGGPVAIPGGFAGNATAAFNGFGRACPSAVDVPQPNPWGAPLDAYRTGGFKVSLGINNDACSNPNGDDLADYISVFFNGCP